MEEMKKIGDKKLVASFDLSEEQLNALKGRIYHIKVVDGKANLFAMRVGYASEEERLAAQKLREERNSKLRAEMNSIKQNVHSSFKVAKEAWDAERKKADMERRDYNDKIRESFLNAGKKWDAVRGQPSLKKTKEALENLS